MAKREIVSDRKLVIGAGGSLGRALCEHLGEGPEGYIARTKDTLDVTDPQAVMDALEVSIPGAVINVVDAKPDKTHNVIDLWRTNVIGSANILDACGTLGIPLIQVSTGDIFGGYFTRQQYSECDTGFALDPYLQSKLAAEHGSLTKIKCNNTRFWTAGFRYYLVRSSALFCSPTHYQTSIVHNIVSRLTTRKDEIPVSDTTVRSPTYVPWLASEIAWLAANRKSVPEGIYHICSSGAPSVYELGLFVKQCVTNCRGKLRATGHSEYAESCGVKSASLAMHVPLCNDKWAATRNMTLPTWKSQVLQFFRDSGPTE